jgi:hypothetical protein
MIFLFKNDYIQKNEKLSFNKTEILIWYETFGGIFF